MFTNLIIFRIYLCCAIIILFPICYFITIELLDHTKYYLIVLQSFNLKKCISQDVKDIDFLFTYFCKRKQWFKCIIMLQFYDFYQCNRTHKLLGICFHYLSYYYIAEYYYTKVLKLEKNLEILENLTVVYKNLKDEKKMKEISTQIHSL